jgi:hypothetical protein
VSASASPFPDRDDEARRPRILSTTCKTRMDCGSNASCPRQCCARDLPTPRCATDTRRRGQKPIPPTAKPFECGSGNAPTPEEAKPMSRNIQTGVAAIAVLLLVATGLLFMKYRQTSAEFASAKQAEESARGSYTEAINSIAEIQDSLNTIVLGDSSVGLVPSSYQGEHRLTESRGDEVLDKIAMLKAGLERTKSRIMDLDQRLKESGIHVAGLQHMLVNLKRSVKEKEMAIADLTGRVDSLQTQVTGLAATVQQKDSDIAAQAQTIEDKRRELGTVLYVIGSKKDLTKQGVLTAKGGVLGMGKTLEPTGKADETLFTAIDTDMETTVHIPATKVQVVSNQPASSYQLTKVGNETELHIIDPKEFRTVKHLVIVTA